MQYENIPTVRLLIIAEIYGLTDAELPAAFKPANSPAILAGNGRPRVPPAKRPFGRWHGQAQPGTLGLMLANAPSTQGQTSVNLHRVLLLAP